MRRDATARPGGDDPGFYANDLAYYVHRLPKKEEGRKQLGDI